MKTRSAQISSKAQIETQKPKLVSEDLSSQGNKDSISSEHLQVDELSIIENINSSFKDQEYQNVEEDTIIQDDQVEKLQSSYHESKMNLLTENNLSLDVQKSPKRPHPILIPKLVSKQTVKKRKFQFSEASIQEKEEAPVLKLEGKRRRGSIKTDQIYRCKCGHQCLTSSGIRRHIKSFHSINAKCNFSAQPIVQNIDGTLKSVICVTFHDHDQEDIKIKKRKSRKFPSNGSPNSENLVKTQVEGLKDGKESLKNRIQSLNNGGEQQINYGFVEIQKSIETKCSPQIFNMELHRMLLKQYQELLTKKLHDDREYMYNSQKLVEQNTKLFAKNEWLKMRICCLEDRPKIQFIQPDEDKNRKQKDISVPLGDKHDKQIQTEVDLLFK